MVEDNCEESGTKFPSCATVSSASISRAKLARQVSLLAPLLLLVLLLWYSLELCDVVLCSRWVEDVEA